MKSFTANPDESELLSAEYLHSMPSVSLDLVGGVADIIIRQHQAGLLHIVSPLHDKGLHAFGPLPGKVHLFSRIVCQIV